jgi:outer membrane immunogenic protein
MIAPKRPLCARRVTERARLMRWVTSAVIVLGLAPSALAADLDTLRGTDTVGPALFTRWSGFYFGGQAGYSGGSADFSKASQSLVGYSLRGLTLEQEADPSDLPVLGNGNTSTTGFGGFVGYNTQWQDLILGLEVNYTHSPFTMVSSDSPIVGHVYTIGSSLYSVNLSGTGTMEITDYGSLRLRTGWIFDNYFLPYGFAGFAMGRGDYNVTTLIFGQVSSATPPALPCVPSTTCSNYSFPNATSGTSVPLYGFSVGGGLDVALTSNIFVRGEFEFIEFAEVAHITASIAAARVGVGLKF